MNRLIVFTFLLTVIFTLKSNADETRLDDEYVKYFSNSDADAAYDYVSKGTDRESRLFTGYHLMFGSGVEKNECAAVLLFEELVDHNLIADRAAAALNIVYGGGWASIAAREGSAKAAFALGLYYEKLRSYNMLGEFYKVDPYLKEKAFINFSAAEKLGFKEAQEYLEKIDIDPDRIQIVRAQIPDEFESIICPTRQHR